MVIFSYDFGSHIARRSACVSGVVGSPLPGDAQVCQPQVPLFVEHQIFGFDIPMHNVIHVQVLQSGEYARDEELGLGLDEAAACPNMVAEVAAVDVVHYQVKVLSILKGVRHIH